MELVEGRDDRPANRAATRPEACRAPSWRRSWPRSMRSRSNDCPFLRSGDVIGRFEAELDSVGDPRPAIEYGLWWLREY